MTLLNNVTLRLGSKLMVLLSIIFIVELLFFILSGNYVIRIYNFNSEFITYYNVEISYLFLSCIIIIFIYYFFSLTFEERKSSYLRFIINFFGSFISLPLGYLIYQSEIAKEYVLINIKGLISISRFMSLEEKCQYVISLFNEFPDKNTQAFDFIKMLLFKELPYLETKEDINNFISKTLELLANAEPQVDDIVKLKNTLFGILLISVCYGLSLVFQHHLIFKSISFAKLNSMGIIKLTNDIELLKKSSYAIKIELDIIKDSIRELQQRINNL